MKKTVREKTSITAHEILLTERDLSLALASASTLDEVLPRCLDTAIRLSGMDSGGIYLVDQKSGDLDLSCSSGLSGGFVREITHIPGDSASARMVFTRKNIYSTYPALEVPHKGARAEEGLRAIAILPVLHKERVIACFNLASHALDSIPEQSRSILEAITSIIGNSIARIQAEEALQQSENRYRSIVENQTEFVCRFTPDGNLTFVNDAYCRYFGLKREECIGKRQSVVIPPDDALRMRAHIKALTPKNPVGELRHRIVMPDGRIRWQRWSDRAIFDKTGHVVEYQSVGRDITDVITTEDALRDSEEKYRTLIERANDSIVIVQDSIVRFANRRLGELWGGPVEEIIGRPLTDFVHPDAMQEVLERYKQRMAGGTPPPVYETILKHNNGSRLYAELNAGVILYEKKPADLIIIRDMTERKRAEEEIRAMSLFQESVISNANVWLMVLDKEGKVLIWNKAAEDISGYRSDEVVGRTTIWKQIYPDKEYRKKITANIVNIIQTNNFFENLETTIRCRDGQERVISWNTRGLLDSSGDASQYIAIGRDITSLKRAQETLRERESLYNSTLNDMLTFVAVLKPDGEVIFVNNTPLKIIGRSLDEVRGMKFYDVEWWTYSGAVQNLIREDMKRCASKEMIYREVQVWTLSGMIWIDFSIHPVIGEDGNVQFLIPEGRDITERKKVEDALLESEERYRSVVEDQTEFICRFTPDGTLTFVNDAYCRYFGLDKNECIGQHHSVVIPPDDARKMNEHIKALSPENPVTELRHRIVMPDGQIRWQRWSDRAIFDKDGHVVEYQSVGRDITDIVQAEKSLKENEGRLDTIIQGSPIPQFIIDKNHRVIKWNEALEKFSGIKADEIIGTNRQWQAFYPEECPCMADQLVDNVIEKTPQWYKGKYTKSKIVDRAYEATEYFPNIGKSGSWLFFTAAPILDSQGTIIGAVETLEDITERKRAEEEILAMSLFQESVISNANVWLMVLDEKGNILLWNNAAVEISGYPADEVIGTNRIWKSLYPDRDYRKKITDTLTGIIKEKKFLQNFETTINCKSGEQKVILWNTRSLEVEKGQGARFVAIGIDTTKSIKAEHALRESEERYRDVVEDQTEFICRFTPDGTLTFVNDAYCRYFGLDKNECIGKHHSVVIPPDDARKMKEHIKALTPENPVALIEHRIIMPSGDIRWQRWSDRAIFDKNGHVAEYQTVGRDITEQKRAEIALQDSERRFADIISFIPDATFAIDREGKIIAWNRAIEKMTGVAAGDMIGKGDHEYGIPFYGERRPILIDLIFGDNEEITKKYPAIQKKGDKFISEIYIQRLYGGKGAHLWFIASPLYDTNGNVTGAIESIRDVSDRKQAEEALIKLNEGLEQRVKDRTEQINASLEEKVVLLREIHHRVKNNLQIIISLLKLQSRYMTDENTIAAFRECQNRVMAMSLVHEKLYQSEDISKIDLGNYVRFLGNSLFQFFGRSGKGVTFTTDIQNISLDINTAIPVGLMINELVSNSLKHAFPDGRAGEISIAIHQKDRQLTIVYKDNGVGIPADFDWLNAKSLGLRLVISLVEQLQGTIELDRSAGTAFTIVVNEK